MHYASANNAPKQVDTKILDEKGQWNDYADKSKVPTDTPKAQMAAATAEKPTVAPAVPKTQSNPTPTVKPEVKTPEYTAQSTEKTSVVKTALAASSAPVMVKTAGSYAQSVENTKQNPNTSNNNFSTPLSVTKTPDMLNLASTAMMARSQDTSKELREIINPVGQTLRDSYLVQKDMLMALRDIAGKISPELLRPQSTPEKSENFTEVNRRNTPDRKLPEVPVSMAKTRYST